MEKPELFQFWHFGWSFSEWQSGKHGSERVKDREALRFPFGSAGCSRGLKARTMFSVLRLRLGAEQGIVADVKLPLGTIQYNI